MGEIGEDSVVINIWEEQELGFRKLVLVESLNLITPTYTIFSMNKKYTRFLIFYFVFTL